MSSSLLADLVDPHALPFKELSLWIDERISALQHTTFTPEIQASFVRIVPDVQETAPFGIEADENWRRFFLGTLLADWACYERVVDRADYSRLKYILTSAYKYTHLWACKLPDGKMTPVGYTAWYPVAKFVYEGLLNNNLDVDDRGVFMPLRYIRDEDIRYGYAFNISIVEGLRNTPCSRKMIAAYRAEAAKHRKAGVMAVTVDVGGRRLAQISRMGKAAELTVGGETETLYVLPPKKEED